MAAAVADLVAALGPPAVLTGGDRPAAAMTDASLAGRTLPRAVVRPGSVAGVAAALRICHRRRQTVVPQGGMTGLAGGANPSPRDVALSLAGLAGVEAIDPAGPTMTVRAGTPLAAAQEAAAATGFLLPIDLGSRGSAQIGGLLATNAGGVRVIRYGMTRDNVLGIEAVLADGTVVGSLSGMIKNNTGYDLRQLLIGSEGTLGVITRAVLRLRPLPASRETALASLPDYDAVLRLLQRARRDLPGLSAFEAMWRSYLVLSQSACGTTVFPDPPPFAVLVEAETEGDVPGRERLEELLGDALAAGEIADALVAQSHADAARFWEVREGHALDRVLPQLMNLDIGLPPARIGQFAADCAARVAALAPAAHVSFYGHIGDGNVHIALAPPAGEPEAGPRLEAAVYELVGSHAGSISAEHGIGTLKRAHLGRSRTPAELALMRGIKATFDPRGILNPGKLLP